MMNLELELRKSSEIPPSPRRPPGNLVALPSTRHRADIPLLSQCSGERELLRESFRRSVDARRCAASALDQISAWRRNLSKRRIPALLRNFSLSVDWRLLSRFVSPRRSSFPLGQLWALRRRSTLRLLKPCCSSPLTELLKKEQEFKWSDQCEKAMTTLKKLCARHQSSYSLTRINHG
jgi:hypothetical protein